MFIPRISASAAKILKEQPYFVAGQLQHYDVAYSPRELTGNGATLMKKLIREGKVSITKKMKGEGVWDAKKQVSWTKYPNTSRD